MVLDKESFLRITASLKDMGSQDFLKKDPLKKEVDSLASQVTAYAGTVTTPPSLEASCKYGLFSTQWAHLQQQIQSRGEFVARANVEHAEILGTIGCVASALLVGAAALLTHGRFAKAYAAKAGLEMVTLFATGGAIAGFVANNYAGGKQATGFSDLQMALMIGAGAGGSAAAGLVLRRVGIAAIAGIEKKLLSSAAVTAKIAEAEAAGAAKLAVAEQATKDANLLALASAADATISRGRAALAVRLSAEKLGEAYETVVLAKVGLPAAKSRSLTEVASELAKLATRQEAEAAALAAQASKAAGSVAGEAKAAAIVEKAAAVEASVKASLAKPKTRTAVFATGETQVVPVNDPPLAREVPPPPNPVLADAREPGGPLTGGPDPMAAGQLSLPISSAAGVSDPVAAAAGAVAATAAPAGSIAASTVANPVEAKHYGRAAAAALAVIGGAWWYLSRGSKKKDDEKDGESDAGSAASTVPAPAVVVAAGGADAGIAELPAAEPLTPAPAAPAAPAPKPAARPRSRNTGFAPRPKAKVAAPAPSGLPAPTSSKPPIPAPPATAPGIPFLGTIPAESVTAPAKAPGFPGGTAAPAAPATPGFPSGTAAPAPAAPAAPAPGFPSGTAAPAADDGW